MLIDIIHQGESDRLEFKKKPNVDSDKWLRTVVAFANCRGGHILFGVDNDRTVCGLVGNLFAIRDSIANAIADACAPLPDTVIDIVNVEGCPIVSVEVLQGRKCPYYLKSQGDVKGVYVRYDATTRQADDATLQELRLDGAGIGYDAVECRGLKLDDAELEELCERLYNEAIERSPSKAHRELVKRVTRSQLKKWGVIIERHGGDVPTNALALLTGSNFLATSVKCAVFKGTDRSVFLDRHPINGSIIDLVNESYIWVLSKLNVGAHIEGLKRVDDYEIPPGAIRELIVNAILHRSYVGASSSSVSIAIYDDRLEITSPGGLPRGMTIKKMCEGHSECRNEVVAAVFQYMFFIENWGTGLLRVKSDLVTAGLPPLEIVDFGTSLRMIVKRRSGVEKTPQKTPQKSSLRNRIWELLKEHPEMSSTELSEKLSVSVDTIREYIGKLKKDGKLRRDGPDRGGRWIVITEGGK